jgi:hypothetical protein
MRHALSALALWFFTLSTHAASDSAAVAAASRFHPSVTWLAKSKVTADFTCRGNADVALLGHTDKTTIVAIFSHGLSSKPQFLEFDLYFTSALTLTAESLSATAEDYRSFLGYAPDGIVTSATCKGLALSDGDTDPFHIYWNTKVGAFDTWRV